MKFQKIPLYVKILIAMALGVVAGLVFHSCGMKETVNDWITPFGEIFMRLLKAVAIPLVFVSLIRGVANIGDLSSLSKIGVKTIGIYVSTTVVAILIGLAVVLAFAPGDMVDGKSVEKLQATYSSAAIEKGTSSIESLDAASPLQPLVDIIPENIVASMSNNGGMLQIIFIAMFIGVAMLMVGREKSAPFANLLDSLDAIVMKIIDLIMKFAPIGVFALMADMVVDNAGDLSMLAALAMYVVTTVVGLLILIVGFYPLLVKVFAGRSAGEFLKKIFPVQLLAFTTSSSVATLPLNMETLERDFGVSNKTASFVLPVGCTINMDGTSLYQVVGVVFIAQVMGIDLSWVDMLTIIATTTISSIGTPGIPGGSIVILMMVLSSVGIPAEGLALILGLDRPLDMLRTVANVTGDATVSLIVDKDA